MEFRKTLSATLAFALAVATSGALAQEMASSMTIVSWGGAYQNSQQKAYSEPYVRMHPEVSVTWDESSPDAVAKMRAMDDANNLTWDLLDVTAADALRLCDEGLAMEIDHDKVLAPAPDGTSATRDFGEMIVSRCFIPQIAYSTTNAYRTDVAEWDGRTPKDICALFDIENFPGKRTLERRPMNNMEWALICDGVAFNNVYDVLGTAEGQRRALAKLDTIKEQTIWWSSAAESIQTLANNEAVIGSSYNGRFFSAITEQKHPIAMLWDTQVYDIDGWVIPEGLPEDRLNRVLDFLYFATDTQRLADQAKYISYGPARASSVPLVATHAELGIEMAPYMPTNPKNANNAFVHRYEWWADYRDEIEMKFQAWLAQ